MGLRLKFNLAIGLAIVCGFLLASWLTEEILVANAREDVLQKANVMMQAALSIRAYTVEEVRPLLNAGGHTEFLPQTVPAYAATSNFNRLRKRYPDYSYKEATLNPTNPADRATDWEVDIVKYFKDHPDQSAFSGTRDSATGPTLYLSHPLKISDAACLTCHSTPAAAPPAMLAKYGSNNGFGWALNDVVGAQIVTVPMTLPLERAHKARETFLKLLLAIFGLMWLITNVLLHYLVLNPIRKMATKAEAISKGAMDTTEFTARGKDEVATLGRSFNLMYRSLRSALRMIDTSLPRTR
jgi:protein-histidine pros-kinase